MLIELNRDGEEPHCERCGKLTSDIDHDNLCKTCGEEVYGREWP